MSSIQDLIIIIPVLLLSLSIHEYSHGKASSILGDPTPGMMGRLTINPLAHLDLMGSLVLIVTRRIGWAKPVPINPRYYKNPRRGMMLVGLAGPGANIILAVVFSVAFRLFIRIYYLQPITPILETTIYFFQTAILINLSLAVFNLLPVPPLDGSKILMGFLPPRYDRYIRQLEGPAGMVLLMILAFTGVLWQIIGPVVELLFGLLL